MRAIGRVLGYFMWAGAGILMFIAWFMAMSTWLGFIGGMLAIILAPALVIFPVVFWIVEGIFPIFYFMLWGLGFIGMIIVGISDE